VSRHMFAEILSLIPRLRAPPVDMRGWRGQSAAGDRERHASMRANQLIATSVPARTRFDRPFARTEHDYWSLHKPVKGSILARNRRESGECRLL
jgi:hypothetical protein